MRIVTKFGGTSVGSAEAIERVRKILESDLRRSVCVVSAPGGPRGEAKVTDLLIEARFDECMSRFSALIETLGLSKKLNSVAEARLSWALQSGNQDAVLAFGEYMSARIMASYTKRRFIDAADILCFIQGNPYVHQSWGADERVVIPGFYGVDCSTGEVRVFPRGGSDISAAYIAKAIGARLYENWTDVPGIFDSDPNQNAAARRYEYLSYEELEALARRGTQVVHPDAIRPAREANIPIHVRSTFHGDEPGTLIL